MDSSPAAMSITTICGSKMNRALTEYGASVAVSVIEALSERYGFSSSDACEALSVTVSEKRPKSRPVSRETRAVRTSPEPSSFPLPFCGEAVHGWCSGIRPNGGLYTQCSQEPDGDSPYCKTCRRQAEKNEHGLPNGGDIGDRIAKGAEWRCPKGKQPIRLANYLKSKKMELTPELREQIIMEAGDPKYGWTIPDEEWIVKTGSRGRPRKTKTAIVDTTATEDETDESQKTTPKKRKTKSRSSPSELDQQSDSSDGEDLVLASPSKSSVVKRRESQTVISPVEPESTENAISPIVAEPEKPKQKPKRKPKMTPEEKEAAKAAKAEAKRVEREAAKAAKLAAKEAEKAAKAEAKRVEREAAKAEKLAAKEAEKAAKAEAKRIEREAAKAEKLAAKEAAKAAKLAEKASPEPETTESEFHPTPDGDTAQVSTVDGTILDLDVGEISDLVGKSGPHSKSAKSETMFPNGNWGSEAQQAEKAAEEDGLETPTNPEPEHDVYEQETEEETDDDSDDDAAGVEEFEHQGKKYLRDPSTNDIFDHAIFMETGDAEEVGTYDPETDTINFLE